MRKYIIISIILLVSSCASIDAGGQKVKLADQKYVEKHNCKFVGAISNSIDYFGDDWVVDLRNKTAKLGGNTLVLQNTKDYGVGTTSSGESYLCSNPQ